MSAPGRAAPGRRRAGRRRALAGALLAGALTAGGLAGPGGPAGAGAAGATPAAIGRQAAAGPSIRLLEQDAWVTTGPGAAFRLTVIGEGVQAAWSLRLTLHERLRTREALTDALAGDLGPTRDFATVALADQQAASTGGSLFSIPVRASAPDDERTLLAPPAGSGAVYPVEVALVDEEGVPIATEFTTFLTVVAPTADRKRFAVAWMWSLAADRPAHTAAGPVDPAVAADLTDGGRLACLVRLAADAPDVPLTFVPDPELLDAWAGLVPDDATASRPDGGPCAPGPGTGALTELRALLGEGEGPVHEMLGAPYVPLDLPALLASSLDGEVTDRLVPAGRQALARALGAGTLVSTDTALVDRLDEAALQFLRDSGVTRLVVTPGQLEAPSRQETETLSRPTVLAVGERDSLLTAVTDPGLEAALRGDAPPTVQAYHFLAALSFAALERPTEERGVVVWSPWAEAPEPATVATVLRELARPGQPLLRAVTVSDYFLRVSRELGFDPLIERTLVPVAPAAPAVNGATIVDSRRELAAYAAMVGDDAAAEVAVGERDILVGQRRDLAPETVRAYFDAARAPYRGLVADIDFPRRVTIRTTERTTDVPVQFQNRGDRPVTVLVTLTGPKVRFPEGDGVRTIVLQPGLNPQTFRVQAQSSGTLTLRITVQSPDGTLTLGVSEVRIRSFAFSGLGVVITVAATLFLAVWWVTHRRRRRGGHGADPSGTSTPSISSVPPPAPAP